MQRAQPTRVFPRLCADSLYTRQSVSFSASSRRTARERAGPRRFHDPVDVLQCLQLRRSLGEMLHHWTTATGQRYASATRVCAVCLPDRRRTAPALRVARVSFLARLWNVCTIEILLRKPNAPCLGCGRDNPRRH